MFTRRVTSLGASPFRRYFSTTANEVSELLKGYQTVVVKEIEWGDMDAFNHVNNVNYLRYFEWVRVRHMSAIAIIANERAFLSPRGVGPILGDIYCRYKGPLTFPDTISVGVKTLEVLENSYVEEYKIISHKSKRVVCEGKGTIVIIDYGASKRAPIPPKIAEVLTKDMQGIQWKPADFVLA